MWPWRRGESWTGPSRPSTFFLWFDCLVHAVQSNRGGVPWFSWPLATLFLRADGCPRARRGSECKSTWSQHLYVAMETGCYQSASALATAMVFGDDDGTEDVRGALISTGVPTDYVQCATVLAFLTDPFSRGLVAMQARLRCRGGLVIRSDVR